MLKSAALAGHKEAQTGVRECLKEKRVRGCACHPQSAIGTMGQDTRSIMTRYAVRVILVHLLMKCDLLYSVMLPLIMVPTTDQDSSSCAVLVRTMVPTTGHPTLQTKDGHTTTQTPLLGVEWKPPETTRTSVTKRRKFDSHPNIQHFSQHKNTTP